MLEKNPNFTDTVGMVKASEAVFNGMANTHEYTDAEREGITHPRDEIQAQTDIYNQPMAKNLLNDVEGSLMNPKPNVKRVEEGE